LKAERLQTNLSAAVPPWRRTIARHVGLVPKHEFVAKIGVVLEEADETQLWLELIAEGKFLPLKRVEPLLVEASELVAIMVTSRKSASFNLKSAI
jgi:four helix bundle protein